MTRSENQCINELKQNFSQIPNALIFDEELSSLSRFVYCFMASKPDGWKFFSKKLAKDLGYSQDTLRKYISELVESGWVTKKAQEKSTNGTFGANIYIIHAFKQDTKITVSEKTRIGKTTEHSNTDSSSNTDIKEYIKSDGIRPLIGEEDSAKPESGQESLFGKENLSGEGESKQESSIGKNNPPYPPQFERLWAIYREGCTSFDGRGNPVVGSKSKALSSWEKLRKTRDAGMIEKFVVDYLEGLDGRYSKHLVTLLNEGRNDRSVPILIKLLNSQNEWIKAYWCERDGEVEVPDGVADLDAPTLKERVALGTAEFLGNY